MAARTKKSTNEPEVAPLPEHLWPDGKPDWLVDVAAFADEVDPRSETIEAMEARIARGDPLPTGWTFDATREPMVWRTELLLEVQTEEAEAALAAAAQAVATLEEPEPKPKPEKHTVTSVLGRVERGEPLPSGWSFDATREPPVLPTTDLEELQDQEWMAAEQALRDAEDAAIREAAEIEAEVARREAEAAASAEGAVDDAED